MDTKSKRLPANKYERKTEPGQTIVLFALMMVALVAFVGIAVDVGFGFVRTSQFSAAVDAATLAGVTDLDPSTNDLTAPDSRAEQFLAANNWGNTSFVSQRSLTTEGIPQYTITATTDIETFFMRIFGWETFPISRSATAAYYSLSEIRTTSHFERGHIRMASQFIFGPDSCTLGGDPVSPRWVTPGVVNELNVLTEGTYRYRIVIPPTYDSNLVYVQLFDPDGYNNPLTASNNELVTFSESYAARSGNENAILSCPSNGLGDRCVIETSENLVDIGENPLWFLRVDENWADQSSGCGFQPTNASINVITEFTLSFIDGNGQRQVWAQYVTGGLKDQLTDRKWVTPGVTTGVTVEGDTVGNSFIIDLDNVDIAIQERGLRYLQLDVRSLSGSGKNVWDLWAGPDPNSYDPPLSVDGNLRNLQIANNPVPISENKLAIYALGRMPVNHYFNSQIEFPLIPVDPIQNGGAIYVRAFDFDISNPPPNIEFTIDSLSTAEFRVISSVVASDPDSELFEVSCNNSTDCNNVWFYPQVQMGLASTLYFPGTMYAKYNPGRNAHTWAVSVTLGRPVLTR